MLVHVVPVIPKLEGHADIFTEGEYENKLIASATTRLADIVAKLQQKGLHARSTVSLSNDPAMEIMRVAESEKSDLIVIATHGTTGWRRLAFGSVTDKLVRNAECSVLVLRAQQQQPPRQHRPPPRHQLSHKKSPHPPIRRNHSSRLARGALALGYPARIPGPAGPDLRISLLIEYNISR